MDTDLTYCLSFAGFSFLLVCLSFYWLYAVDRRDRHTGRPIWLLFGWLLCMQLLHVYVMAGGHMHFMTDDNSWMNTGSLVVLTGSSLSFTSLCCLMFLLKRHYHKKTS